MTEESVSGSPSRPSSAVDDDEVVSTMSRLAPFAGLSWAQLTGLRHLMEETAFVAGDRLVRTGLDVESVYFILEGTAAVEISGAQAALLGRGDAVGEVAAILGAPSIADVVAVTPVVTLALPAHRLEGLLAVYPTVGIQLLKDLALRLRTASRWIG